ncbi:electron transfer flavoprotein subunit beta/FixA family protein [Cuneatibacter sp. NSJ-177]|uniref:electron transfer flavoprotein subunit beta/FixA family protein n=1 Tax=Cuneatibacter sp. NSJ-177 TaxID=2931401 RepID=UPI001FD3394A|nr:electron transfer flavoprotein subunit beta/FixA family protein [Cuneatibacter sp. NSJ-177]MCJ7837299.1 electron transfer flavoprotein subunit beta/FixA family protein [Cuneatibacter sp. NSJ-177]
MKIIVCIKQVPSSNEVRLDPVTKTIVRDGKQSVINPFDAYAIEEAVRLKETCGGAVTALSMGIPATERLLRDAMSRGVDEAVLLSDRVFAGSDTLATSYALSLGVRKLGPFSLILCGKMAVDGDTAQIGPELAEMLGIPHVTEVNRILSVTEEEAVVEKQADGFLETLSVKLPALLTVSKDINMPRLPSIAGIRYSEKGPFRLLGAADVGADPERAGLSGSPTQVVKTETPRREQECTYLEGTQAEQAAAVLDLLREVRR